MSWNYKFKYYNITKKKNPLSLVCSKSTDLVQIQTMIILFSEYFTSIKFQAVVNYTRNAFNNTLNIQNKLMTFLSYLKCVWNYNTDSIKK